MVVKDKIVFTIDLNKDYEEVSLVGVEIHKNGYYIKKNIEYDSLIKVLNNSSISKHYFSASVPENSYYIFEENERYGCIFFVKGRKLPLVYSCNETEHFIVPYPNMLFKVTAMEGGSVSCNVYAIKDEKICDSTRLYQFPFSNVSKVGHVCFGGNDIHFSEPKALAADCKKLVEAFFSSPYNGDYYTSDYTSLLEPDLKKLISTLSEYDVFPDILVDKGITAKDLIN